MFTPEIRDRVRKDLLDAAAGDRRITGGAITGSAAADGEDRWSDIDLAFGVGNPKDLAAVLSDWTSRMYDTHGALHHLDVPAGAWIYRVFLLPTTLQVDLGLAPASEFKPLAPTFRLVFGEAGEPCHSKPRPAEDLIGWGWLYALHARSCIARRKFWQAEYMISGVRDTALALACVRHDVPSAHGRGIDRLPSQVTARFEDALVQRLDTEELVRAFRVAMQGLMTEIQSTDPETFDRLHMALTTLSDVAAISVQELKDIV